MPAPVNLDASSKKHQNPHAIRETVESVIVAFILAFLFRAFVAEAFVIPTGSMAPTLMGAHKDTICEHCGTEYQSTASPEFDKDDNGPTNSVAVGGTCSICRATNAFDLAGNRNHATFSGDRILVSKFDYLFRDPERWDVLVFKYPTDA
ncbi:MAG: S26 family signal peptidase, partial [Aureliella sp.]